MSTTLNLLTYLGLDSSMHAHNHARLLEFLVRESPETINTNLVGRKVRTLQLPQDITDYLARLGVEEHASADIRMSCSVQTLVRHGILKKTKAQFVYEVKLPKTLVTPEDKPTKLIILRIPSTVADEIKKSSAIYYIGDREVSREDWDKFRTTFPEMADMATSKPGTDLKYMGHEVVEIDED